MRGIKTFQVRVSDENHKRLVSLKEEMGVSSWDDFVLALAETYPTEYKKQEVVV